MRSVGTTWEWHDNGDLSTRTAAVPAVRVNPRSGKKVFFNSVVAAYTGWVDSRNDPLRAVCFGRAEGETEDEFMDPAVRACAAVASQPCVRAAP